MGFDIRSQRFRPNLSQGGRAIFAANRVRGYGLSIERNPSPQPSPYGRGGALPFFDTELSGVGVRIIAGRRWLGRTRAARQRKILALIQRANAALVEAGFIDLQVGAVQR